MHPVFHSIVASYAETLNGLTAQQVHVHPASDPSRWNAQQIVEHLVLSYRSTRDVLGERLEKGRATQAPITREHEVLWRKYIGAGRFPQGSKARKEVSPGNCDIPGQCGKELASFFESEIEKMDAQLSCCAEKFGTQPMASHFAFGPLSADQWREFHVLHARHHLVQIHNLVSDMREPHELTGRTESTT